MQNMLPLASIAHFIHSEFCLFLVSAPDYTKDAEELHPTQYILHEESNIYLSNNILKTTAKVIEI